MGIQGRHLTQQAKCRVEKASQRRWHFNLTHGPEPDCSIQIPALPLHAVDKYLLSTYCIPQALLYPPWEYSQEQNKQSFLSTPAADILLEGAGKINKWEEKEKKKSNSITD